MVAYKLNFRLFLRNLTESFSLSKYITTIQAGKIRFLMSKHEFFGICARLGCLEQRIFWIFGPPYGIDGEVNATRTSEWLTISMSCQKYLSRYGWWQPWNWIPESLRRKWCKTGEQWNKNYLVIMITYLAKLSIGCFQNFDKCSFSMYQAPYIYF
jgi:hypothetical protein